MRPKILGAPQKNRALGRHQGEIAKTKAGPLWVSLYKYIVRGIIGL